MAIQLTIRDLLLDLARSERDVQILTHQLDVVQAEILRIKKHLLVKIRSTNKRGLT